MRFPRNASDTWRAHKAVNEFDGSTPPREDVMVSIEINGLIHIAAATLIGAAAFLSGGAGAAHAASKIVAHVDISEQRMEVLVDGKPTFEWKVSTAGKGYVTPTGAYKPTRLEEMWYSKKYDNSPMPHSSKAAMRCTPLMPSSGSALRLRTAACDCIPPPPPISSSLSDCSDRPTPASSSPSSGAGLSQSGLPPAGHLPSQANNAPPERPSLRRRPFAHFGELPWRR
jgi:L,D-transpeptidase catalytic domain